MANRAQMSFDVFISYAWTSDAHREWVRLLAAHLRLIGFSVGIDADVDYGNDLSGFMRKIPESEHVLMIIDDNYTKRADNVPDSGVAFECGIISKEMDSKPANWAAVLLVNNDSAFLPRSLHGDNRKYFDFRSFPEDGNFPGTEQIDDLWRWLANLAPDKGQEVSPAVIRERMYRVERVNVQRSPGNWSYPQLERAGIVFYYEKAPRNEVTVGASSYAFRFQITDRSNDSVYVYSVDGHAVGLVPTAASVACARDAARYIQGGRFVYPAVNQRVVIQNENGCICLVMIERIVPRRTMPIAMDPYVVFSYKVFLD